jgi:hypothetical protein
MLTCRAALGGVTHCKAPRLRQHNRWISKHSHEAGQVLATPPSRLTVAALGKSPLRIRSFAVLEKIPHRGLPCHIIRISQFKQLLDILFLKSKLLVN